jgi:hypothetical protein
VLGVIGVDHAGVDHAGIEIEIEAGHVRLIPFIMMGGCACATTTSRTST